MMTTQEIQAKAIYEAAKAQRRKFTAQERAQLNALAAGKPCAACGRLAPEGDCCINAGQ
jgi:regulator of protease activity HflC (stomatin/prohibitin superfamily)